MAQTTAPAAGPFRVTFRFDPDSEVHVTVANCTVDQLAADLSDLAAAGRPYRINANGRTVLVNLAQVTLVEIGAAS
jgi:hypothetical protein